MGEVTDPEDSFGVNAQIGGVCGRGPLWESGSCLAVHLRSLRGMKKGTHLFP